MQYQQVNDICDSVISGRLKNGTISHIGFGGTENSCFQQPNGQQYA